MIGKPHSHCWNILVCLAILSAPTHCARIRRVVGGEPIAFGTWPWLVSLNYKQHHAYLVLQGLRHLCGGTLVNESWILTAAHCVHSASGSPGLGDPDNWIAVLGEYNRGVHESTEQQIEIEGIYLRNYTLYPKLTEDIALLKLKTPAQVTGNVRPIALDTQREIPTGTWCRAAGWGQHTADEPGEPQYGNGTMVPHVVHVRRISQDTCHAIYGDMWPLIDDKVLCYNSELSQDTCKGDSGGPLICYAHDGQAVITGVVSVGVGCALPEYPGIYTRVSSYSEWILRIMANY